MAEITAIAPNENGEMAVVDMTAQAIKKLEGELTKNKEPYAQIVIKYLIGRVKESKSLANDVMQEHKSWARCWKYIYAKASKAPRSGNCAAIEDKVVYEWAEDYYIKDDKAEAEKEAKAEAQKATKKSESPKEKKSAAKKPKKEEAKAKEEPVPKPKPKKKPKDEFEGQMSLADLFGGF